MGWGGGGLCTAGAEVLRCVPPRPVMWLETEARTRGSVPHPPRPALSPPLLPRCLHLLRAGWDSGGGDREKCPVPPHPNRPRQSLQTTGLPEHAAPSPGPLLRPHQPCSLSGLGSAVPCPNTPGPQRHCLPWHLCPGTQDLPSPGLHAHFSSCPCLSPGETGGARHGGSLVFHHPSTQGSEAGGWSVKSARATERDSVSKLEENGAGFPQWLEHWPHRSLPLIPASTRGSHVWSSSPCPPTPLLPSAGTRHAHGTHTQAKHLCK